MGLLSSLANIFGRSGERRKISPTIVGLVGLLLLLAVVLLEAAGHHGVDVERIAMEIRDPNTSLDRVHSLIGTLSEPVPTFNPYLVFLRELSFALIIAAIIGVVIESVAAREQVDLVKQFQEQQLKLVGQFQQDVAADAISGALGMFLPEPFRDAFRAIMSQHRVIRTDISTIYELHEIPDDEIAGSPEYKAALKAQFIQLRVAINYVIVNVSGAPVKFTVKNGYPVRPEIEGHGKLSRIRTWKIAGKKIDPEKLSPEWSEDRTSVLYSYAL